MAMSQVATDNFNRANEAPLSDGGNWSAGYLGGGTGLAVVSDACEQGATTATITLQYGPDILGHQTIILNLSLQTH